MKYVHDAISNELRDAIYNHNVKAGWWDEPVRPDGTTIALIHSEISESWGGFQIGIHDHHLPQYSNALVELADAAIRIYDFFGHKKWDLNKAVQAVYGLCADSFVAPFEDINMAAYYADLHYHVSAALEGVRKNQGMSIDTGTEEVLAVAAFELAITLDMIYTACYKWGWPLDEALGDKRAYNANRADHKRENRAKEDGKKF